MKTITYMISLCSRTGQQPASTRTSIERLARAIWQTNSVTMTAKMKVAQMSSKCSDKLLVGLSRAEQTPQPRTRKEAPRNLSDPNLSNSKGERLVKTKLSARVASRVVQLKELVIELKRN